MADITVSPEDTTVSPTGKLTVPLHSPRRRRRPALSCNECRRRKVKCDQKVPCTQCIKSKHVLCKYDPDATPKARELNSISGTPIHKTTTSRMRHIVANESVVSRNSSTSKRYLSPESFLGTSAGPTNSMTIMGTQSSKQQESQTQDNFQSENVEELKDRLKQLETMVTSLINVDQQVSGKDGEECPQAQVFPAIKGGTRKCRFFTTAHWMNTKAEFTEINAWRKNRKQDQASELNEALKRCKSLARAIKSQRPKIPYNFPDFKAEVPSRATADHLVQLYFTTFESAHRILHRHAFYREYEKYWANPSLASDTFIIKMLLVMSIGTIFTEEENMSLRSLGLRWINSAQIWLDAPLDKSRLNLASVEIQCLLLLARQTHSVTGDLLWISMGSLIRTAMSIGLHRDPSNFHKMSIFQEELRRRLWATIIELSIQASLDSGMPPMISPEDYDCEPPSNLNDIDLNEETQTLPTSKPQTTYTETSIQRTLLNSLPTRLKIFKLINDFRSKPAYEKVLALSTELISHLSSHSFLHQTQPQTTSQSPAVDVTPLTPSHLNTLDLLTRRFLLALHLPFALRAKSDPRFYFSRKIALDTSLIIFSYPDSTPSCCACPPSPNPPKDSPFARMKLISGGPFREAFSRASSSITLELIAQISEDSTSSYPSCSPFPPLSSSVSTHPTISALTQARKPLHDSVDKIVGLSRKRLERGETNVKGFLFWSMVRAQIVTMESSGDVREAVGRGAREAAEEAWGVLRGLCMDGGVNCEGIGDSDEIRRGERRRGGQEGMTIGSLMGSESTGTSPGDLLEVDWDGLMQDSVMDIDFANTWLLDSWENV